jgi:hypothetical protein
MSPAIQSFLLLRPRIMQSGNAIVNNPMDFFVNDAGFPWSSINSQCVTASAQVWVDHTPAPFSRPARHATEAHVLASSKSKSPALRCGLVVPLTRPCRAASCARCARAHDRLDGTQGCGLPLALDLRCGIESLAS